MAGHLARTRGERAASAAAVELVIADQAGNYVIDGIIDQLVAVLRPVTFSIELSVSRSPYAE